MKIKSHILKNFFSNLTLDQDEVSLSLDSRSIKNGDIFVALNGEKFKAAKFVEMALNSGACHAVVNEEDEKLVNGQFHKSCFFVEDTTTFLKELATRYSHLS